MFGEKNSEASAEGTVAESQATFQAEKLQQKQQMMKVFGWHWHVEDVAKYTNSSYFEIMMQPFTDILGIIALMYAKAEYLKL
jgi:hypothetical protein